MQQHTHTQIRVEYTRFYWSIADRVLCWLSKSELLSISQLQIKEEEEEYVCFCDLQEIISFKERCIPPPMLNTPV